MRNFDAEKQSNFADGSTNFVHHNNESGGSKNNEFGALENRPKAHTHRSKGSADREKNARRDGAIRSAWRRSRQTQTVCCSLEAPVARRKSSACGQQDRRKQVSTDIADAEPEEQVLIDEMKNLSICRDLGLRQVVQHPQNEIAPR